MSRVVWSALKGWHDGPEVTVSVVKPIRASKERARTFAKIHAAAVRVEQTDQILGAVFGPVTGMCSACGSVEVTLLNVRGHRDLSSIGEASAYPVGYGCEVCS